MSPGSSVGVLVVLAALGAAGEAFAQNAELKKAEKQFEALNYREAEKALVKALAVPKNDRATVIRIYELRGILDATVGKKSALEHFRRLVAISPDHVLSRDYGPRILTPFYEAKARLDENPAIKLELTAALADGSQTLTLQVLNDSLKLGARVKLWWRPKGGEWTSRTDPVASAPVVQAVASDTVEYYAQLFSPNDGLLVENGSAETPLLAEPPPPPPPPPTLSEEQILSLQKAAGPKPMSTGRKVAIATGAVGVASLGGALAAGIISRTARNEVENPPRDEQGRLIGMTAEKARELELRTVNSAIAANVLLGVGAGLVAVGVVLFIADPGGGAKVAVAPAPGGVVVAGEF